MLLLFGPIGGMEFNMTRTFFVHNYTDFIRLAEQPGSNFGGIVNFGAGNEYSFVCPICGRKLPMAIVEVDHIFPRTSLNYMVRNDKQSNTVRTSVIRNGDSYTFQQNGKIRGIYYNGSAPTISEYDYHIDNSNMIISANGNELLARSIRTVLENDIENLQLICGYCNRSKGNRY